MVGVAEGASEASVAEAVGTSCVPRVGVPATASRDVAGVSSTGVCGEPAFARAVKAIAVGR